MFRLIPIIGVILALFFLRKPIPALKAVDNAVPLKEFKTVKIPMLLYHDIKSSEASSIEIFRNQVKTLKVNDYTFLTVSDVADILDGGKTLPKNPIVLTFDDGYESFYTEVFPVLKENNARGTVYIVTSFIDKPGFLTTKEIEEISKNNLVEIGAHSVNHFKLKSEEEGVVLFEVAQSKVFLERVFKVKVATFAYPYGAVGDDTEAIVRRAGFRAAVSTARGTEIDNRNRFSMYRFSPEARRDKDLLVYIEQVLAESHPIRNK